MRETIFRGKRVDNGEWVEGFLFQYRAGQVGIGQIKMNTKITHPDGNFKEWDYINVYNLCCPKVIPETVGQYTGYTDDYAKKIFEGDILRVLSTNCYGNDLCYTLTLYDMTDSVEMERINTANEVKVIGNIHDNPELLDGVQWYG